MKFSNTHKHMFDSRVGLLQKLLCSVADERILQPKFNILRNSGFDYKKCYFTSKQYTIYDSIKVI